jgi:hypothetical protein
MPKISVGVGEEFPAGDPPQPLEPERPPRRRGWHFAFHIFLRLAFIALVIGLIGWVFFGGPIFGHGPYPDHAGWHGHFFPFFPLLLVLFLIFAFRRRRYGYGCYGYDMRRWHDELHRERGERS